MAFYGIRLVRGSVGCAHDGRCTNPAVVVGAAHATECISSTFLHFKIEQGKADGV
jgi:hypothetical protein